MSSLKSNPMRNYKVNRYKPYSNRIPNSQNKFFTANISMIKMATHYNQIPKTVAAWDEMPNNSYDGNGHSVNQNGNVPPSGQQGLQENRPSLIWILTHLEQLPPRR